MIITYLLYQIPRIENLNSNRINFRFSTSLHILNKHWMKPQSLFFKQNKDIKRNTYVQHRTHREGRGRGGVRLLKICFANFVFNTQLWCVYGVFSNILSHDHRKKPSNIKVQISPSWPWTLWVEPSSLHLHVSIIKLNTETILALTFTDKQWNLESIGSNQVCKRGW